MDTKHVAAIRQLRNDCLRPGDLMTQGGAADRRRVLASEATEPKAVRIQHFTPDAAVIGIAVDGDSPEIFQIDWFESDLPDFLPRADGGEPVAGQGGEADARSQVVIISAGRPL